MKISITKHDLKNLEQEKDGTWTYRISTVKGDIVGSNLPDEDTAISHAEEILLKLNRKMLKKI